MGWKQTKCEGCWWRCRYVDLIVHGAHPFQEGVDMLKVDSELPSDWKYKRRSTVLGVLHEMKRDVWLAMVNGCPRQGMQLSVGDPVQWWKQGGNDRAHRIMLGVVARVVPAGEAITPMLRELKRSFDIAFKARSPKDHVSYLIAGRRRTYGGTSVSRNKLRRKRGLYWPPVHRLRPREDEAPF